MRHGSCAAASFRIGALARAVFILLYLGFLLLPLYWVAVTSIKPQDDLLADPPIWWPSDPTRLHYTTALNSFGLEGPQELAHRRDGDNRDRADHRHRRRVLDGAASGTGGKHLAFWFLSQRMLPPIAVIIPIFLLYSRYSEEWFGFQLIDTKTGLVLLYTVFALPFTVWMMYVYFRQMPVELEEAALVDGCSRVQAIWKIACPLAAPGLVSAAAFAFIFS